MKTLPQTLLASAAMAMLLCTPAAAQVPSNVMDAYKAYNAAMEAADYKTALSEGRKAWKNAESAIGDGKTTGDLAFNYGFLEQARGNPKSSLKALERAAELSATSEIRMEREVELVKAFEKSGELDDAVDRSRMAQQYAAKNGLSRTVFVGELLVHDTNACNRRAARAANQPPNPSGRTGSRLELKQNPEEFAARIQKECAKTAERALSIFQANPKMVQPKYMAAASNAVGYAHERAGDFLSAALAYQTSRDAIEDTLGRQNGLVAHTIGRWVNARARLEFTNKLDEAKAAGLCDCWPYTQTTPKVAVTDRGSKIDNTITVNNNLGSGYAILKVDVTDSGQPTNIRVLDSWPGDAYVARSERKLSDYSFAPKTGDEPADYRKDLTVPFTYTVFDRESQDVY
ncbi:hypothetical protein [Fretibacter rubidus]|uniref:hypothetical protein n=1 Tax=Fretibacter rubidus TaxID=570162 RepID=UPI00352BA793